MTLQLTHSLDKRKLANFLEVHGDSLYGIAFQKSQSEVIASEIIERTFVIACQRMAIFDATKQSLFRWILNIMHQVIADNYHQRVAA